jgi:hypothetical protein
MEIYQDYGNDLIVTPTGDLQSVDGLQLSNQRIMRRLLTAPITVSNVPDYLQAPTYGAGLPQFIGRLNTPQIYNEIKALITAQMYLEETVAQTPPPEITLFGLPGRLTGTITYTYAATNQQAVINFQYPSNATSTA